MILFLQQLMVSSLEIAYTTAMILVEAPPSDM